MAKKERLKIGIIFNFDPIWMGGIIYIQNLIRIMSFLDDPEKPEIILFYRKDLKRYVDEVSYDYLRPVEWSFPGFIKGYLLSFLSRKNHFIKDIIKNFDNISGLYPVKDFPVRTKTNIKLVGWTADLQHKYYPQFLGKRKVFERNERLKMVLKNSDNLVVSSQAVADDVRAFYNVRDKMKLHIFHFSSVIGGFEDLDFEQVREKHRLPHKYFIVANQFHKHKNHEVVFKALSKLTKAGRRVHVALTGRFPDATRSPYMQKLHDLISSNKLHNNISILGLVPREEQLLLMKYAQGVIQPSLFEGWSTVIEDAISLQVPVIASSINVNQEQLGGKGVLFSPHDSDQLAQILVDFPERNINDIFYEPYRNRVKNAARSFVSIFNS